MHRVVAALVFACILATVASSRADDSDAGATDAGADASRRPWDWEVAEARVEHEKHLTFRELVVRSKESYRERRVVDALRDAQRAVAFAEASGDTAAIAEGRELRDLLISVAGHVRFVLAPGAHIESIGFDVSEVPMDALGRTFTVNPGDHEVSMAGLVDGEMIEKTIEIYVEGGIEPTPISVGLTHEDLVDLRKQRCVRSAVDEGEARNCRQYGRPHACAACELTPAAPPAPSAAPWAAVLALLLIAYARRSASPHVILHGSSLRRDAGAPPAQDELLDLARRRLR